MNHLLGIDIGTSGTKAVLIKPDGAVTATATFEYPLSHPHPLWAEQDPEAWWEATVKSIRAVLEKAGISADSDSIAAVGLTGQMHGLVMLDRSGKVLRPAILWNDQRTAAQCAAITERVGEKRLLELTGNPVLPGFTAPKILWVRENEPEIYQRCDKILLPKDYIRYRLSGEFLGDVSDASGTSLFDVARRQWSGDMLDALELPRARLPEITESTAASAAVSADAARATGLREGTPIAAGGGDQAAGAVGTGMVAEGMVSVTLGTSGVVFAPSSSYRFSPEGNLHAFCHAVPGQWHLMGVMLSAAGSFRWFRDTLGREEMEAARSSGRDAYDLLTAGAGRAPAGCDGLLFLPYLSGERTPHPDPEARGVFFGLTLRHNKDHLTRAVLEGVTHGLRDSLDLMKTIGLRATRARASGGGAKSAFWLRMLADMFGMEIVTVNGAEGAPYGAALLAGVAAGVYESVPDACETTLTVSPPVQPDPHAQRVYEDYHARHAALYPALKKEFQAIARLEETHRNNS